MLDPVGEPAGVRPTGGGSAMTDGEGGGHKKKTGPAGIGIRPEGGRGERATESSKQAQTESSSAFLFPRKIIHSNG